VGDHLVVLTEGTGGVHQAGAVLGGDEVALDHAERVLVAQVVVERRGVTAAEQIGPLEVLHDLGVDVLHALVQQFTGVGLQARFGQHVPLRGAGGAGFDHHVVDVGSGNDRQVGGQGPRCGGPD